MIKNKNSYEFTLYCDNKGYSSRQLSISFDKLHPKFCIDLSFLGEDNGHLLGSIKFHTFEFSIESSYKHQIWFKYKPDFTSYIEELESHL